MVSSNRYEYDSGLEPIQITRSIALRPAAKPDACRLGLGLFARPRDDPVIRIGS